MTHLKRLSTLFAFSILAISHLTAQLPVENTELLSINMKGDEVHFIKISERGDLVKPVLIFSLGSQPVPLIFLSEYGPFISNVGGFDYKAISRNYHIIIISNLG